MGPSLEEVVARAGDVPTAAQVAALMPVLSLSLVLLLLLLPVLLPLLLLPERDPPSRMVKRRGLPPGSEVVARPGGS